MDADQRAKAVKDFDATKGGVKGLIDSGLLHIPNIFIRPPEDLAQELTCQHAHFQVPVIDLDGMRDDRRKSIVNEIKIASKTLGIFQVVNHGIHSSVLEEMVQGVRKFNEQTDVGHGLKEDFYSRDPTRKVKFNSNYDLYRSRAASWRDTLTISLMDSRSLEPQELPAACRNAAMEYIKHAIKLEDALFELLSEALGLKPDHLRAMECAAGHIFVCHYYPPCPEPELTLGVHKHSDPVFLTILMQNHVGGLQALHQNHWVDVNPIPGGLVVNIGDLLQILSNDEFKSVEHRVIANRVGPRMSVACFSTGQTTESPKLYSPIRELTSEENPPLYREFLVGEYRAKFLSMEGVGGKSCLDLFKL